MNRNGKVFYGNTLAGVISETDSGYQFQYESDYLKNPESKAISKTLPKTSQAYVSKTLFPFFDGLIPEGWLLDIAVENWKLNLRDRMGLLLTLCKDCIGAVSVHAE